MSSTLAERLAAALPEPADAAAATARQRLIEYGLPTAKVESWRYSSLRGMQSLDPTAGFVGALPLPDVNGVSGTLLQLAGGVIGVSAELPAGLALAVGTDSTHDRAASTLAPHNLDAGRAFEWLNAADTRVQFAMDVVTPVPGIWRLALQHDANGLLQLRGHIRVHENASISLMEHWYGADEAAGLANVVLQVELAPGAELSLMRVQETGSKAQLVQSTQIHCGTGSRVALVTLELGGLWSRHDLAIDLDATAAEATVTGLVALQGRQHHDTQFALTHAAAGTHSKTLWKAIANGRARSVFDGLISVAPGADQTEAHLKTANLLLSPHAEIDTKPELVIEADEVVCSHGATVGQLDDKALFYLRSRGISAAQARQMLTLAFGGEVLSAITDNALRMALAERVSAHLPQDGVD